MITSVMGRRQATPQPALSLPPPPSSTSPPPSPTPQAPPTTPNGAAPAPSLPPRRQPVLLSRPAPSRGARCAEVAGGTAADCAAVCCCCPCGILNLLVLAVVKLPAGLCRRAVLKHKKKLGVSRKRKGADIGSGATDSAGTTRRGLLGPTVGGDDDDDDEEFVVFTGSRGPVVVGPGAKALLVGTAVGWPADRSPSEEVSEMDKKMWAHFYGGGFWRSPSQRDV